ncbi:MAG: T9SS type A sorting domain-containing protein [Fibrobacteres bacterium]|nr:T9SS type A sorting domain-containing protein [Fibrobacterota bacterium]
MRSRKMIFALLTLCVLTSIGHAVKAFPAKVMVQIGDTANFGPLFGETNDTSISSIVPEVIVSPVNGTVTLMPARRSFWMAMPNGLPRKWIPVTWFRYIPKAGFTGVDSFSYKVNDGIGLSNTASCIIRVHPVEPGAMTVLVVANKNLESTLSDKINRLKDDLAREGYRPRIVYFNYIAKNPDTLAARELWDTLSNEYNKLDGFMAGAIILGRMPSTYSSFQKYPKNTALIGEFSYWNMSLWLSDMEANGMFYHYADSGNVRNGSDTIFSGFDSWDGLPGNALRHIWISRFIGQSRFGLPVYGDSVTLLKRMLDANHDYRTGTSRLPHKAYYTVWGNKTLSDTAMKQVFPEVFKLPVTGKIINSPGDTVNRIFTPYLAGEAGEMWDVGTHANINFLNPTPNWLKFESDSLFDRPFQNRVVFIDGCHAGGGGSLANMHLQTRGGGCVLSVGFIDYHSYNMAYTIASDTSTVKKRMRKYLASGQSWGRVWIRSGMPTSGTYWHGDLSVRVMMAPSNKVPVITQLRKEIQTGNKIRLIADARDDDGTITAYEWWFSKKYNSGRNEPDTVTTQSSIDIDAARCTTNVRLEIVDNYKARFFLTMHKDSIAVRPAPTLGAEQINKRFQNVLSVSPNPFNSNAQISFYSAEKGLALLSIFDAKGSELFRKPFSVDKGYVLKHQWNTASNGGRQLPAGTYFISLKLGSKRLLKKVILLR